jgi:hypothetical protein
MVSNISDRLKVIAFDYKQNVCIPFDPIQPSMYYYHSKRNCNIFGVTKGFHLENIYDYYIYDECDGNKSANEVVTLVLNSIRNMPLRSSDHLVMYMDNCTGQNKNGYLVAFCVILVLIKLCSSFRMKFLLVGHTHNNCDRGFAHLQKILNKETLFCTEDVVRAAKKAGRSTVFHFEEFFDYKKFIKKYFKGLKDISKTAEIMVDKKDPTLVHSTTNTLSCCVHPEPDHYENKETILRDGHMMDILQN